MPATTGNVIIAPNSVLSGANPISTFQVTRDSTTENVQAMAIVDAASATPVNVSGAGEMAVNGSGQNRTILVSFASTSASPNYPKASAGRVCKLVNAGAAQIVSVTIIDQATGAASASNVVFGPVTLGQNEVIPLDIPCNTGIGIYASGTATGNIILTWS